MIACNVFSGQNFNGLPNAEKLAFDSHYMTEGMYYAMGFVTDTIEKNQGCFITSVYTRNDKRLLYIEFSPIDMRGLYRNN
ncbi:MAG: hypothetical protein SPL98_02435 [Bacteroidales bacterium]|nr:hypothetical protein [Bacteroidales bacterium]MDY6402839.1 hypothetical protein [Bacteroidales bacterium]MDY6423697.1 hypothetical protein [Bacteroidales bacterium]